MASTNSTNHARVNDDTSIPMGEDSPLLFSPSRRESLITAVVEEEVPIGNASVFATMVNMAKACMGPGCLVLPFAARQGGLWLHTVGLLAIAVWNIYIVRRLCQCLDYLPATVRAPTVTTPNPTRKLRRDTHNNNKPPPPEGTAMFGQVVWYALGKKGLFALDLLMLLFLLGILIAYINAMRSFLRDTPLSTQSPLLDALLLVAIMGPLSSVPHMGYLSKASALGLVVLAATFVVIGIYGVQQQQQQSTPLHGTPQEGLWGISQWFGSVVFSFGVAPLTYNFRSSMADPTQMVTATTVSLMSVALAYMGIGIFFWALFPTLQGDLLQALPTNQGFVWPSLTRLAMVLVGLTTVPLLVVPCGELLEGKLIMAPRSNNNNHHHKRRILVRCGICLFAVGVSLYVPGFVDVLSFVGCCCVACLGFCIPPLLHLLLGYRSQPTHSMILDAVMLVWGIFATVVSTTYTFRQISTAAGN
ncbi:amino acid [Seminavis robusta]|uniref:Amino acid n=1 Tax=Seminavis robusta TaxID=568900 RepID=A0A9N8DVK2_9STRA|nr:amino acid [Seminavis robusta]|eukprot:Sro405_g136070.1 amino acid (473) ;mRNA; f:18216-19634